MKKIKGLALLVLGLCVVGLAGCGKKEEAAVEGKQKLVIWGAIPEENGVGELVAGFQKENPELEVSYSRYVNDDTGNAKLDTALISGEQIDVFFAYNDMQVKNRVDAGIALNLAEVGGDKFAEKEIGADRLLKIDGELYGIPTAIEPASLAVNKDMFDEAGIEIPDSWTWDEFREVAKKLTGTQGDKKVYGVGGLPNKIENFVLGGDASYKGDTKESNFEDPKFEIKKLYHSLIYDDQTAYPFSQVVARNIKDNEYQLLLSGDAAMTYYLPWMSRVLSDTEQYPREFKIAFAPIPTSTKGEEYYTIDSGNYIMMNSNTKDKESAWKFVEYWLTKGGEPMLTAGKIPPISNVSESKITEKVLGEKASDLYDVESFQKNVLNNSGKYTIPTRLDKKVEIGKIMLEEADKYYLDEIDFDTYITNMKTRADKELQK